jgi:hypothetical protein
LNDFARVLWTVLTPRGISAGKLSEFCSVRVKVFLGHERVQLRDYKSRKPFNNLFKKKCQPLSSEHSVIVIRTFSHCHQNIQPLSSEHSVIIIRTFRHYHQNIRSLWSEHSVIVIRTFSHCHQNILSLLSEHVGINPLTYILLAVLDFVAKQSFRLLRILTYLLFICDYYFISYGFDR